MKCHSSFWTSFVERLEDSGDAAAKVAAPLLFPSPPEDILQIMVLVAFQGWLPPICGIQNGNGDRCLVSIQPDRLGIIHEGARAGSVQEPVEK